MVGGCASVGSPRLHGWFLDGSRGGLTPGLPPPSSPPPHGWWMRECGVASFARLVPGWFSRGANARATAPEFPPTSWLVDARVWGRLVCTAGSWMVLAGG